MAAILRRRVIPVLPVTADAATPPTLAKRRVNAAISHEVAEKKRLENYDREARKTVERYRAKISNYRTAIRAKCVECSNGSLKEVADCLVKACALYPFRMGENPFNKKTRERMERQASMEDDEE